MSRGPRDPVHAIESCTLHLHTWRPFAAKTLDSDPPKPHSKRPCLADRTTSFSVDMSRLSLFDEKPLPFSTRWFAAARKRRRRGSRSVSGRSSDRRCGGVSATAANGTCSDFVMAAGGTDSSGELFGEANWASDVSERNSRREREGEREGNVGGGWGQFGNFDSQGNESGYGSEPGYRGDVELGYGDEFDEEEDDPRALFWGDECGDNASKLERMGDNSLQKGHPRCRRKKQDMRMVGTLR